MVPERGLVPVGGLHELHLLLRGEAGRLHSELMQSVAEAHADVMRCHHREVVGQQLHAPDQVVLCVMVGVEGRRCGDRVPRVVLGIHELKASRGSEDDHPLALLRDDQGPDSFGRSLPRVRSGNRNHFALHATSVIGPIGDSPVDNIGLCENVADGAEVRKVSHVLSAAVDDIPSCCVFVEEVGLGRNFQVGVDVPGRDLYVIPWCDDTSDRDPDHEGDVGRSLVHCAWANRGSVRARRVWPALAFVWVPFRVPDGHSRVGLVAFVVPQDDRGDGTRRFGAGRFPSIRVPFVGFGSFGVSSHLPCVRNLVCPFLLGCLCVRLALQV